MLGCDVSSQPGGECCPSRDGTGLGLVLTKLGQSIYTTEEGFLMERVESIYYNIRDEEVSNYLVIFMAKIDWLPSFLAGRKRLTMLI